MIYFLRYIKYIICNNIFYVMLCIIIIFISLYPIQFILYIFLLRPSSSCKEFLSDQVNIGKNKQAQTEEKRLGNALFLGESFQPIFMMRSSWLV